MPFLSSHFKSDAQIAICKYKNEHKPHMGFEWDAKSLLTVSTVKWMFFLLVWFALFIQRHLERIHERRKRNLAINGFRRKPSPCVRVTFQKRLTFVFNRESQWNSLCFDNICDLYWFSHKRGKKVTHSRHTVMAKKLNSTYIKNYPFHWPRNEFLTNKLAQQTNKWKKKNQKFHFVFIWN